VGLANGQELARGVLSWSTSSPGASPGIALQGEFNLTLSGTFTGLSARLQRSFDGGATWTDCTALGQPVTFTGPATEPCGPEPEAGVLYRVNVSAIASGTVAVRLSQ
jgi:hypothetical protein